MKSFKEITSNEPDLTVRLDYTKPVQFDLGISEAYSFFPKTEEEIKTQLASWPEESITDTLNLFNYLKPKSDTPINIDVDKPKHINVVRALKGDFDIKQISSGAKLSTINIKFGNGSMGGRGINNKGKDFEDKFAGDIERWYAGEDVNSIDAEHLKAILHCDKLYNWSDSKTLSVTVDASANTPRPIKYGSKIELTNIKGTGFDLGPAVTDITVVADGVKTYLSMKSTGTVTFFNVGVRTVLTPSEIQTGKITNTNGLTLLKLFGIDPVRFCGIFNDDTKTDSGIVSVNSNPLVSHLLQSGIGYGYHVLHKNRGKIHSYAVTPAIMRKAANVSGMKLNYGGKTGKGKRIDIEMESSMYKFKLNIRDTQGKDGYPTRLMCDFATK